MKLIHKLGFLALALSTGMASAAAPLAGSALTNQATADFTVTDPATNTTTPGNSASNQVSTTITAVPSFTITPNTGAPALTKVVAASTTVSYTYTVTNTGNTPLAITLASANTTNTPPSSVTLDKTTVTLAAGATTTVTQTYTVAGPNTYGQNLTGTALYDSTPDATTPGNNSYTESYTGNTDTDNANVTTVNNATPATPGSPPVTNPTPFPLDPNNPGIVTNPTPPTDGTPPGTGTGYTQPNGPTVPGGPILPGAGTPIQVATDGSQTGYPKADGEHTGPDTVTMTGTAPNNSGVADNITVGPAAVPSGSPAGTTATIINPATGNPFVNGEVPVDINGNPISGATVTVNPNGSVTFNNVPSGTAPAYSVQVTYPDTESPNAPTAPIVITVPITSGNAGGQAIATPTYTVKTPGLDLVVVAQDAGTTLDNSGQTATPSSTGTTTIDFTTTVTNKGSYSDAFNITSGTNNLPVGATVSYVKDGAAITSTGQLAPGATFTFITRVTLPVNATAGSNYSVTDVATGAYSTITDTDGTLFNVGIVSPITPPTTDITNPTYTSNPLFPLNKKVDKTTALPGDVLTYSITATNKYNAPVCQVILTEIDNANTNIFANSTYQSITGTSSAGTVLFGTSKTGPWSATAPAAGPVTALYAALDSNNDAAINTTDCLPVNGTINLTLQMKVNQ